MINYIFSFWILNLTFITSFYSGFAQKKPQFSVIGFYTTTVERDHVDFANNALKYISDLAVKDNFVFDTTTNWGNTDSAFLSHYNLVLWINEFPHTEEQRRAFEKYMENGGGWIGFHVSGYNDKTTNWPWFVDFMCGAVFYNNNWPPLAAKLVVDVRNHPVTKHVPSTFIWPINEWYGWKPSPRLSQNAEVLVTLDSSNYPLGKKNLIRSGDIPVVWTNKKYRMLYMNMGHGDLVLSDSSLNRLIEDAILWVGRRKK
jgi:type 1 glutamine amidotransferase